MRVYIFRRLLLMIPTVFLATTFIFLLVRFIPGSMVDLIIQDLGGEGHQETVVTIADVKHRLGLDVPVHIQYVRWMAAAFQGDLGTSMWTQQPITDELVKRIPVSLELGILALLSGLAVAVPIGVYSGIRQDTAGDYAARTMAILGISVPGFWMATMVIVYPAIYLNWSPPLQYIPLTRDPLGNFQQFIIPALLMGAFSSGTVMRMTRTMMLEVLRQDYIRTAWSKGLTEWAVVFRHALRNAMIPVITTAGVQIPFIVGGSIIFEQIFALPGMGLYLIQALTRRDYNVIVSINLVIVVAVLAGNLVVDLTYGWLDPRIKYN